MIELIVVMVIIGILAAIAIPSYVAYIQRSNRSDARAQMLLLTQWMERFRNENSAYDAPANSGNPPAIPAGLQCSPAIPNPGCLNYTIAIAATAGTYILTAAPVLGGPMATDECGTFSLNHLGVRAISGTGTMALCWNR